MSWYQAVTGKSARDCLRKNMRRRGVAVQERRDGHPFDSHNVHMQGAGPEASVSGNMKFEHLKCLLYTHSCEVNRDFASHHRDRVVIWKLLAETEEQGDSCTVYKHVGFMAIFISIESFLSQKLQVSLNLKRRLSEGS